MLVIKEVSKMIRKGLKDAHYMAEAALKYKEDYPELAKVLNTQAEQRRTMAMGLHEPVKKLIEDYRKTGKEPPAVMLAMWDYSHEILKEMDADLMHDIEMFRK